MMDDVVDLIRINPEKMTISALGAIKTLRAKEDILSFYK